MNIKVLKPVLCIIIIFSSFQFYAQSGIVSGVMRDDAGEVLPGVSINIKNTTKGTMSLADGSYSIECSVGDVLVISYIGMEIQEVKVSSSMFSSVYDKPLPKKKKVKEKSVDPIRTNAYTTLLNNNKIKHNDYSDMSSAPYKWAYKKYKYNSYFQITDYKHVSDNDSVIVFERNKAPVKYGVEFNSFTISKSILKLPALQNKYAQGRPDLGVYTWFGPETDEIFAWGPKIENLAYDGSDYAYDTNGRLIPKSVDYPISANRYDPYEIFKPGFEFKNSIQIKLKRNDDQMVITVSDRREKGVISPLKTHSDLIKVNFKKRSKNHDLMGGFRYFTGKGNFLNTNALWTKTMASILLSPPTFNNSQGYMINEDMQRSSAIYSKNNPYFLFENNNSIITNESYQTYLHYSLDIEHWYFISELSYQNDFQNEAVNISEKMNGFNNDYIRNKDIQSSDIRISLHALSYYYDLFNFQLLSNYRFSDLNYKYRHEISDVSNKKISRQSVDIIEGFEFSPRYSDKFILNVTNNNYISGSKSMWFLPKISFSLDIAELFYYAGIPYLNINGAVHKSVAEFPLSIQDKSYESLLSDISQFNSFYENSELLYDKDLKLETRTSYDIGIDLRIWSYPIYLSFRSIYNYTKTENSIFPIINNNSFELNNVASIAKHNWESSFTTTFRSSKFKWESKFIFSFSRSKVLELFGNQEVIPIAGFSSVSKNLIEGEQAGVIIGSVYERNEAGQMIIGNDGFPIMSDKKQIIGDPNPDYYMALDTRFELYGFTLGILIDHQRGGDIWNGTGNILDYHGLSAKTQEERIITDYIFEGIDENGNPNTIPVDYANPEHGIASNRWVRYGYEGIAEDAIEDATWFRIKEIDLTYKFNKKQLKFIKYLSLSLYMNNVYLFTKYSGSSPVTRFNNYTQGQGLDLFNFPEFREIGFRLNLKI